jgi:syntaxin 18
MTNEERDVIDRESEKIIPICTQFICELKVEYSTRNLSKQQRKHSDAVFELLADYLKSVYNIFNDQKNYRIRRDLETYKFLKLDSEKRHDKFEVNEVQFRKDMNLDEKIDHETEPLLDEDKEEKPLKRKLLVTPKKSLDMDTSIRSMEDDANTSRQQQNEENGLSAEDLQMLEIENKQMLSEFKGLSEEVQQIEKHVYDIAKLQELFTEKVR